MLIAAPLILSLAAKPLAAGSPVLDLPARCILGEECWPMALFDHAPGPDVQDHRCAAVSYDGHDGTDIGTADLELLARGIQVIAAAPGQVGGVRDGMADVDVSIAGPASVQGRECGNGVVIRHEDGWETQYCHLRQGSLAVRSGQWVERGDVLGLMGMSGLASYPHLHLGVRHLGKTVDPFAPDSAVVCPGQPRPGPGLWSPVAAAALQDASAAIVAAGVASQEPRWEDAKAGRLNARLLPARGKALIVWMEVQMVQPGDRLKIKISGPDGRTVFQQSIAIDQPNRRLFRYFGRRTPNNGWPLGVYPIELSSIRARDGKQFRKNLKAEMVNPE